MPKNRPAPSHPPHHCSLAKAQASCTPPRAPSFCQSCFLSRRCHWKELQPTAQGPVRSLLGDSTLSILHPLRSSKMPASEPKDQNVQTLSDAPVGHWLQEPLPFCGRTCIPAKKPPWNPSLHSLTHLGQKRQWVCLLCVPHMTPVQPPPQPPRRHLLFDGDPDR